MALPLLLGAIGAGTGLISSLLGSSSKNSQIDDLLEELKKSRYSEDDISRRQNEVKRTYGNTVDSMIGSAGFLNGDTARMIANSKIATQSAQAQIKERFALEDQNKQLDLKSAELSGQKIGTAGILSSALLDTLNTGIQGYTTGSYLDMLNPTKETNLTQNNISSPNVENGKWSPKNVGMDNEYEYLLDPEYQQVHSNLNIENAQIPQIPLPNLNVRDITGNDAWALDNVPTQRQPRISPRQQTYNAQQTSNMDIGNELRGRPSNASDNLDLSKMLLGDIMKMFDVNQNQDFRNKKKQLPFAKSYFDMNFFGGR